MSHIYGLCRNNTKEVVFHIYFENYFDAVKFAGDMLAEKRIDEEEIQVRKLKSRFCNGCQKFVPVSVFGGTHCIPCEDMLSEIYSDNKDIENSFINENNCEDLTGREWV